MHKRSRAAQADYEADLDARVLRHVTAYPGLSCYEIGRGVGDGNSGNVRISVSAATVRRSLARLAQAGKVVSMDEAKADSPSGTRQLWRPA